MVHGPGLTSIISVVLAGGTAAAQAPPSIQPASTVAEERTGFEDYRRGVGRFEAGVLRVTLEARAASASLFGSARKLRH